jgi:hypothetical protein
MKIPSLRTQLNKAKQELTDFRAKTKELIYTLAYPKIRKLMTIDPATEDGKINGITIPELVMLINLNKASGERIVLCTEGKSVLFIAEAVRPAVNISAL